MSNEPFGLAENPFATPELTAAEATRLVRGRAAEAGADAEALFPDDTCAELHRLARGRRGGVFALAGRAMRIAAREGASSVGLEHVRAAVAEAGQEAGGPPAEAATPSEATAVAETAEWPRPNSGAEPTPAGEAHTADVAVTAGGILLPSEPSEDLDPDQREWVGRFLNPGRAHAPKPSSPPAPTPVQPVRPAARAPEPKPVTISAPPPPAAAPPAPRPRRSPRSRPQHRHGRRGRRPVVQWLLATAAVVAIGFVVIHRLPRMEATARKQPGPAVPASLPPAPAPTPTPVVAARPEPHTRATPVPRTSRPAASHRPVVDRVPESAAVAPPSETESPASDAAAPGEEVASHGHIGIEVASFIFEDRAQAERDRLTAAGRRVRIVTQVENGAPNYRVIVGPFRSRAAAERAADALLSRGLVEQASVVTYTDAP